MKKCSLAPYHGDVWATTRAAEIQTAYKRRMKSPYPYQDTPGGGRYIKLERGSANPLWLVLYSDASVMAHELSHVLLQTFDFIGHDPTEGDGEPFCYMLTHLMQELAE